MMPHGTTRTPTKRVQRAFLPGLLTGYAVALCCRSALFLIFGPRIRCRQPVLFAERSHLVLLVSSDSQGGARLSGTQQNESSLAVFRKINQRIGLIHFAFAFEPRRTRQTVALMT